MEKTSSAWQRGEDPQGGVGSGMGKGTQREIFHFARLRTPPLGKIHAKRRDVWSNPQDKTDVLVGVKLPTDHAGVVLG